MPWKYLCPRLVLVMAMTMGLGGCVKMVGAVTALLPQPSAPTGATVERGLEFVQTENGPLQLDLYRPESGDGPFPLVVYAHGGAWMIGHRKMVGYENNQALELTRHGYAVASVSYRLTDRAIFPAQIRDLKSAICWLRIHADQYNLDPERVASWGPSAGGHLASLAGTAAGVPELEGQNCEQAGPLGSRVQAVVDFFGPVDLTRMDERLVGDAVIRNDEEWPGSRLLGGPVNERPEVARAANPITYISEETPPFLIVHGAQDPVVPYTQSELLYEALQGAGVESFLYLVEEGGHGVGGEFGSEAMFERVLNFLDRHLRTEKFKFFGESREPFGTDEFQSP